MNADCNLSPQVHRQLLEDLILSHNFLVDVKMLVPVVNTMSKLLADVMATQVCLHLKEKNEESKPSLYLSLSF